MKKTLLTIINIIAWLAFFVGALGIEAGYFLTSSIVMSISLAWLWVFLYANG